MTQIGADGGRKWQMVDFSQNLAPGRSRRWLRWLSHRNEEAAACAVTTAKTSASHNPFRQTSPNTTAKTRGKSKNHTENGAKNR